MFGAGGANSGPHRACESTEAFLPDKGHSPVAQRRQLWKSGLGTSRAIRLPVGTAIVTARAFIGPLGPAQRRRP